MGLFFQLIVLARQRRRLCRGLLLGGEHLPIHGGQCEPGSCLLDQGCRGTGAGPFESLRRLMLHGFMLLEGLFKGRMRIAPLPRQVLLGVVEFILIECQLRVYEVQLVVALRTYLFGQLRDAAMIPSYLGLQSIYAFNEIS